MSMSGTERRSAVPIARLSIFPLIFELTHAPSPEVVRPAAAISAVEGRMKEEGRERERGKEGKRERERERE